MKKAFVGPMSIALLRLNRSLLNLARTVQNIHQHADDIHVATQAIFQNIPKL